MRGPDGGNTLLLPCQGITPLAFSNLYLLRCPKAYDGRAAQTAWLKADTGRSLQHSLSTAEGRAGCQQAAKRQEVAGCQPAATASNSCMMLRTAAHGYGWTAHAQKPLVLCPNSSQKYH